MATTALAGEPQSGSAARDDDASSAGEAHGGSRWTYAEAFCRNAGLISDEEQERLRNARVAIPGMGGVGGQHLVTLARMGVGRFTIADPDTFEVANTNRQSGARLDTLGRSKAEVMAEEALRINPDLDIRVFREPVSADNVDAFLEGADVLLDGIDLYAIDARLILFRAAAERGLYAVTAGPVGFSTAWLTFDPAGMSFDRYFDLTDDMDRVETILAFLLGSSPSATQLAYMDIAYMNFREQTAPSVAASCQLASGVAATEVVKILLDRGGVRCAPYYQQFDAHLGRLICKRLHGGNRHPWQRLKRWWLYRQYRLGRARWTA
ncbi:tRNA threonylcarbamoyladenosine dehydratase [Maioricimonas rarisocia]|uniref:tRNA threonylcarbamoyladenosine dehydratase n=1 Tax=Maioricimonas rarisocia TaxID=2528026 RepID=A0A517Z0Q4_9PLAN|nr:ThiF family adenylyltransferase [Maioricimonas rarisocia]QDU36062.1 tRNA threonylcarbamoyladenosine dehydratase [Maioricimonas rarisocia]